LVVVASGVIPAAASAGQFKPCVAERPVPFTDYWLGAEFDATAVTEESYTCAGSILPPEFGRTNLTSVIYGEAAQVQTWPACDRWYGLYPDPRYSEFFDRPELTRIRGVPAARFEEDARIELYTGDVTVVVFADTQERAERAVGALRPRAAEGPVEERLPPALRGAVSGRLDCGAAFEGLTAQRRSCGASGPCSVSLAVRLRRKTYVTADFARRVGRGRYEEEEQDIFTAAAGTTRRTLRLRPGRYRLRAIGWEPRGRRTAPRTYWFRVRRR
jgi:hypothetical protein